MDLAKYRALFLEEAAEHLSEMSRALLDLEKDPASGEAIDALFRSAHSIKGMAGSLEYDAITELSHKLEDAMAACRAEGSVDPVHGIPLLFRGLEGLERMVGRLRDTGEAPEPDAELVAALAEPPPAGGPREAPPQKKV